MICCAFHSLQRVNDTTSCALTTLAQSPTRATQLDIFRFGSFQRAGLFLAYRLLPTSRVKGKESLSSSPPSRTAPKLAPTLGAAASASHHRRPTPYPSSSAVGAAAAAMAGLLKKIYSFLLSLFWSTEMDITMIGLQNAGKTSLLRVLAVSLSRAMHPLRPRRRRLTW